MDPLTASLIGLSARYQASTLSSTSCCCSRNATWQTPSSPWFPSSLASSSSSPGSSWTSCMSSTSRPRSSSRWTPGATLWVGPCPASACGRVSPSWGPGPRASWGPTLWGATRVARAEWAAPDLSEVSRRETISAVTISSTSGQCKYKQPPPCIPGSRHLN